MRNYAPQLVKAYELATSIFNQSILEEEKRLAVEYDNEKSNSAIILFNQETNQILRLPYYMRFKREYVKAIKRKMWREIYPQITDCCDFLFLTLDASTSNYYSQSDAHRKVQKHWNSLLTRIRKKYSNVRIIKVVEWQRNGIGYHLHVLIVGIRFLPKDWIARTWYKLETSGWSIEIEKVFDNPRRALSYLLKYVTKTLRQNDEIPLSLVINWALHLRTIAVSRSFSSHKTNSNGTSSDQWIFLGIMPLDLALTYSDQEILDYFEYG
jgi:hypothetical protein